MEFRKMLMITLYEEQKKRQIYKFKGFQFGFLGFPFFFMLGIMKNNLDGAPGRYEVGLVVNSVVLYSRGTRAGAFHKALRQQ